MQGAHRVGLLAPVASALGLAFLFASVARAAPLLPWGAHATASATDQFGSPPLLKVNNADGGPESASAFVTASGSVMREDGSVLSATASATASLRAGKVGAYATGAGGGTGGASSVIDDTITLNGGSGTGMIPVRITGLLTGTNPLIEGQKGDGLYTLAVGPIDNLGEYVNLKFPLIFYEDADIEELIDVTFEVPASNPVYRIRSAFEFVNASGGAFIDFANSADISSMTVPNGITPTSASGVFLADVPEPAAMPLLMIAAVGILARRSRKLMPA